MFISDHLHEFLSYKVILLVEDETAAKNNRKNEVTDGDTDEDERPLSIPVRNHGDKCDNSENRDEELETSADQEVTVNQDEEDEEVTVNQDEEDGGCNDDGCNDDGSVVSQKEEGKKCNWISLLINQAN